MKTNTNIFRTFFILCSLFFALNTAAQAPQKMSYQAVIRNASNALIANTAVGIKISVLQTSGAGTAVYVERQTPTTHANGLASIEIGGGTLISGNFGTINWANGPYFIKTETDPTGGTSYTISGTSQLLSVPYALFAANTGSANTWGLTGNAGTDPFNNFIGTTDANPLVFRVQNAYAGRLTNNGMVALGWGAANVLSDGSIVAIGKHALLNNGTGSNGLDARYNTAIGSAALTTNTKGYLNTATGFEALKANTIGNGNTASGAQALLNNNDGDFNTATGNQALRTNTTGNSNTAYGNGALSTNVSSSFNTALGSDALLTSTGGSNTAVGASALKATTDGVSNVAVGSSSLINNVSGNTNTAIGSGSLLSNLSGSSNTALGRNADVTAGNLTNATAIGAFAKVGSSNSLVLGASENAAVPNVNVGIGIQSPQSTLHVNPNGAGGIFIGKDKNAGGTTGLEMGVTNLSGGGAYVQSTQAAGSLYGDLLLNPNGGQVGIGFSNPTSVQFPLDINQSDNKGIRLSNGPYKWDISNNDGLSFNYNGILKAYISISGSYVTTSDARLKKDVKKMPSVLDKVMVLQPKTYKYISNEETDTRSTGFIAQEVMPLFPELVTDFQQPTNNTADTTVYHGINYAGFSVVAIKAIQEQQLQISFMQKDNKAILSQMDLLKAENKLMQQQMEKMQAAIEAISKK